jgi:hypothetical protein
MVLNSSDRFIRETNLLRNIETVKPLPSFTKRRNELMSERIKNNVQAFIVQQLAAFSTPQEIVNAVKEIFNEEISRQLVATYDPTRPSFSAGKKWKSLFYQERGIFLTQTRKIPIANKAHRLQMAQNALDRLRNNTNGMNIKLMLQILEYAAKEEGGMFTNKREVTIMPTPQEMARGLYRELISDLDFTPEEAMEFVTDRYKVHQNEVLDAEFLFEEKEN